MSFYVPEENELGDLCPEHLEEYAFLFGISRQPFESDEILIQRIRETLRKKGAA